VKRRLAWAAALGLLPALALGLWSEWQSRQRIARYREEIGQLGSRREQLEAVARRVAEHEAQRKTQAAIVRVLEGLRAERQGGPARVLRDIAVLPETSILQIETLWAQDGYLELSGRARSPADVNRAGQALEQRGHLDLFDVWRFDPDGGFALLGRLPEPDRGARR
jgi:Tfp pilus assembly protein PilN